MPVSPKSEDPGLPSCNHYLPIYDTLLHSGLYVTSVGRNVIAPGQTYPPEKHPSLYQFTWKEGRKLPECSLLLVTNGAGTLETRPGGRFRVEDGMMFLLLPGVWHRYRPDSETGWTERWVQFNGDLVRTLMGEDLISPSRPVFRPADLQAAIHNFDRLINAVDRDPSVNSPYFSLLAMGTLAVAVSRPAPPAAEPEHLGRNQPSALASAAIHFIWTRSHRVLSVPDIAEFLGVTRRTLERHMMAATGGSVLDEITRCRFSRAERLLRETDLPVKAVMNLAGFGSTENMRQTFCKKAGISPQKYRERFRNAPSDVPLSQNDT